MNRNVLIIAMGLVLVLSLSMCESTAPEFEEELSLKLEVNVSPDNAGSVSPDGGRYVKGQRIVLRALPGNGWQFDRWSGDSVSTSNPFSFIMVNDLSLIANFVKSQEPALETFTGIMTVSNGNLSRDLEFGIADNSSAANGLDENDKEGPPVAPPGVFNTGFQVEEMNLFRDIRSAAGDTENVVWVLKLSHDGTNNIELSWSLDASLKGEFKLLDDPDATNAAINVNMRNESTFLITNPNIQNMYLVYTGVQPQNTVTDIDTRNREILNNTNSSDSEQLNVKKGIDKENNIRRNNR